MSALASSPISPSSDNNKDSWRIWKFGGSSLRNGERVSHVADLILEMGIGSNKNGLSASCITGRQNDNLLVVVSACAGVTNKLVGLCEPPANNMGSFSMDKIGQMNDIVEAHQMIIFDLVSRKKLSTPTADALLEGIKADCYSKIRQLLDACTILGNVPHKLSEVIKGFGEIWSSKILTQVLIDSIDPDQVINDAKVPLVFAKPMEEGRLTAETCVITAPLNNQEYLQLEEPLRPNDPPQADLAASKQNIKHWWQSTQEEALAKCPQKSRYVVVCTGYVCRDHEGGLATLGRNGSDYTGALMANILAATGYTIWSDVEGVFTADPRIVPQARCVPSLTYEEAMELSFYGASVIHPMTMQPCISGNIPIVMRSSYHPERNGTIIAKASRCVEILKAGEGAPPIKTKGCKSITTYRHVSLITLQGSVMFGGRGLYRRVFHSLDDADVDVLMISQASSEHTITFGVRDADTPKAKAALTKEFFPEMSRSTTFKLKHRGNCAILCTVGDDQQSKVGYFAGITKAIAEAGASIISAVQGATERLICIVIDDSFRTKVVTSLHTELFPELEETQEIPEANTKTGD